MKQGSAQLGGFLPEEIILLFPVDLAMSDVTCPPTRLRTQPMALSLRPSSFSFSFHSTSSPLHWMQVKPPKHSWSSTSATNGINFLVQSNLPCGPHGRSLPLHSQLSPPGWPIFLRWSYWASRCALLSSPACFLIPHPLPLVRSLWNHWKWRCYREPKTGVRLTRSIDKAPGRLRSFHTQIPT